MDLVVYRSLHASGWVVKRGNYGRDRKRFVVLTDDVLLYYKSDRMDKLRGQIVLSEVVAVYLYRRVAPSATKQFAIEILTKGRTWLLFVRDEPELDKWRLVFLGYSLLAPVPATHTRRPSGYVPVMEECESLPLPQHGTPLDCVRIYMPKGSGCVASLHLGSAPHADLTTCDAAFPPYYRLDSSPCQRGTRTGRR